jgi:protein TonB
MDISDYDPLGGQGGGGAVSEPEPPPLPEPEPEPEPEELVETAESTAPEAEEIIPPPPLPPEKPQPRKTPRPKPKPRPQTAGDSCRTGDAGARPGPGGSGPGGTPQGTGGGTSDAALAYRNRIRQRLERSKKYPPASQSRHETGVAVVSFIVQRDGTVTAPQLETSSGHKRLDDEALALLSRVSPLPPFPPEVSGSSMPLSVPLRFSRR